MFTSPVEDETMKKNIQIPQLARVKTVTIN